MEISPKFSKMPFLPLMNTKPPFQQSKNGNMKLPSNPMKWSLNGAQSTANVHMFHYNKVPFLTRDIFPKKVCP